MGGPTSPYQPYAKQHERLQGPGDARPTALQVLEADGLIGRMEDKVMIVTGCTAGMGIETARALHATGAKLFLAVRNQKKGEAAVQDILKTSAGKGPIELIHMDLGSLASVRSAAADILSKTDKVNVIIANAASMLCSESKTENGFEMQIGTCHFGHFLFFQLLKKTLLASGTPKFQSRVVMVSSSGHRVSPIRFHDMHFAKEPYNKWVAYGQAKTANCYMANSIERHYGSRGLHSFPIHPGVVWQTEGLRHVTDEDVAQMGNIDDFKDIEKTVPQGAATQVWAAVSPQMEGKGGVYLSDVGEAKPAEENELPGGPGYGPHAYDEEAEEKLWVLSYEAVGLPVED